MCPCTTHIEYMVVDEEIYKMEKSTTAVTKSKSNLATATNSV